MMKHDIWRFAPPRRVLLVLAYSTPLSMFDLDEKEHTVVVACPNPPREAVRAGKAICIRTKVFHAQSLIDQLPAGYAPEIVQLSARNLRYRPHGLARFGCPTVLKLGDTFQWGDGSLSQMVDYARELQCDYHWSYQCPQHLHYFVEAGLKNVFWLPGTIATPPYIPVPGPQRKLGMIFRGSLQGVHGQRRKLLAFLRRRGVSVDVGRGTYQQCLDDYANATISFNCSANGDLNRRVYEVLMAGGFLLTDRLSSQSGLHSLFREGEHLECYGNEDELLEKARYYLKHPEKARAIAERGQQELLTRHHPVKVKQLFQDAILSGRIDPLFRLGQDPRATLPAQTAGELSKRLKIYEVAQELHALNPRLRVLCAGSGRDRLLSDLEDLPRIELNASPQDKYDLIYSEDSNRPRELARKLAPGGILALKRDAPIDGNFPLRRVNLVDAVTRSVLAKDDFHLYRAPGTGGINVNLRRFPDRLRDLVR